MLPQLFRKWGTTCLTFEEDPEPYGQVRDKSIAAMCEEMGVAVVKEPTHTLFRLQTILDASDGDPPLTYRQFTKMVAALRLTPATPAPALSHRMVAKAKPTLIDEDHNERYGVPSLAELGNWKSRQVTSVLYPCLRGEISMYYSVCIFKDSILET